MFWYRNNGDGSATVYSDSRAIREEVDANPCDWFGSAEGAILHGGVLATAYARKTEQTYDAVHWLKTKELVPMGEITITEITAEPKA
jgi:hypothetical protein